MGALSKKSLFNPFFRTSSLEMFLFFAGWGIWWSFFQIWLTTKQGFTGAQIGTIYSFNSAAALILLFVFGSLQDKLRYKKTLVLASMAVEVFLAPFFEWVYAPLLQTNFYLGAGLGAIYLTLGYLALSPTLEALTERFSRRYSFEYGQARAWGSLGYALAALCAGYLFTVNPSYIFWAGSGISLVLFLVTLFLKPENDPALRARYETDHRAAEAMAPTLREIFSVFGMADVWKMIFFILFTGTFYTVFDQQMFPEFFTRFFATPEEGQQMYGVLNSFQVFLEFVMMSLIPLLIRRIGVRKAIILAACIMFVRIGGCSLVTNALGIALVKLLHAPETALMVLAVFRYFTLHFDTRLSATLYMVGFQLAGQIGQILLSTPLGMLRDAIGYQSTFYVVAATVFCGSIYAYFILKKDDEDVGGQPL